MEGYPQILNLIQKGYVTRDNKRNHEASEERKLELKLGPPGENNSFLSPHKRGFQEIIEGKTGEGNWVKNSTSDQSNQERKKFSFSEEPNRKVCLYPWASSFPHSCDFGMEQILCPEKNTCSPTENSPPDTSHKRISLGPVVGWPPVRSSFRRNIATNNSSKAVGPESSTKKNIRMEEVGEKTENIVEDNLFVKINMDGIPIGRKIDLKAYDSYEKLSSAVDQLFSGLLAAQGDCYGAIIVNNEKKMEKMKVMKKGLLDGRGEFTLVYEDNEGDRMLVGDVPWNMFISSAKRLRVLKRSELSALHISSSKLARSPLDSAAKDPMV